MQKALRVIVLLTLCLAVWAGPAVAAEKILWWHWNAADVAAEFQPAVDAFTKATGIEVEQQYISWSELKQKIMVGVAGGVTPDVTAVTTTGFEELSSQGVFEPLDAYIKKDSPAFWRDIFPASMDMFKGDDGKQYAVPFDNDLQILHYNKNLFDQAGTPYPDQFTTWDDWLELGAKQTRDVNGDGKKDYYGMMNWWANWKSFIYANGGDFFTPDKRPNLNSEPVRQALEFWAQWYPTQRGIMAVGAEFKDVGYDQPYKAWWNGLIAMTPAGAWMPSYYVWNKTTGKYNFDFDVAPMPLSYAGRRATINEGQGNAVVASSKHKDAAFLFAKWMSDVQAQRIAGLRGQFPIRRSVALSPQYFLPKEKYPANRLIAIQAAEYARPYPKGVAWGATESIINKLSAYWNGTQSLDVAITTVSNLLEAKLKELKVIK